MTSARAPLSSKPASTTNQITIAARDVFLAEGYEAASMEAIARHADVSKATLYAHFASKEVLFNTVMIGERSDYAAELDQIANDRTGTLEEQLTKAGTSLLTFLLSDAKLRMFRVIFSEGGRIPEICQNFLRTTREHSFNRFADIFCHGTPQGHLSQQQCEEAARLFISTLRGDLLWNCLIDAKLRPSKAEIDARVSVVVKMFVQYYTPSPSLKH